MEEEQQGKQMNIAINPTFEKLKIGKKIFRVPAIEEQQLKQQQKDKQKYQSQVQSEIIKKTWKNVDDEPEDCSAVDQTQNNRQIEKSQDQHNNDQSQPQFSQYKRKPIISLSSNSWQNQEQENIKYILEADQRSKQKEQKIEQQQAKIQEEQKQFQEVSKQLQETQSQYSKQLFTHFFSIPLNKEIIIEQVQKIQEEIISATDKSYIKEMLTDPKKLHITLLLLNLNSEEKLQQVQQVFKKLEPKLRGIFKENPNDNVLSIQKMNYFGENAQNAKVLYLEVQQNRGFEVIKKIVNLLVSQFIREKVITAEDLRQHITYNKVNRMYELEQLHITILKSSKLKSKDCIDVGNIFNKYKNIQINNIKINSIELSSRQDVQENGFYKSVCSFQI